MRSREIGDVLAAGRTERRSVMLPGGTLEVLVEVVRPPIRMVVCGDGHDAMPLIRFAHQPGWEAVVVDDRASFLTQARFPKASAFVHAEPRRAAEAVGVRERIAVVVMSHNFLRDLDYLESFLGADIGYLEVLGPSLRL